MRKDILLIFTFLLVILCAAISFSGFSEGNVNPDDTTGVPVESMFVGFLTLFGSISMLALVVGVLIGKLVLRFDALFSRYIFAGLSAVLTMPALFLTAVILFFSVLSVSESSYAWLSVASCTAHLLLLIIFYRSKLSSVYLVK
ncbi:TPA: hypothetical protein ACRMT2_004705 [Pseudomonas aeruginosa]|jgi:hypothetical protein|uniref:hypothetical protein n=1 Tax=Pseudomonas aeruginosa TaxID=287 RepID=UPI0011166D33|nr:hypothetical protein [Pseudomonas aeruginosa]KAA5579877.1 hypothetical protein F3G48_11585 [Pseudomonas aeruginosa]MBA4565724.1 hypothetical protein [Pseudomonas aeruginosa]MBG6599066.1 hypothetical protein [Pseudomonas aeruginosa]MCS7882577.1 hypothetical protein [Pseudomonas aeruginosa]MCS9269510.1 hypothetical protein [Pseudomonas aeruginosa]